MIVGDVYHGTLAQNIQSIRRTGLSPRRGAWTTNFHSDAVELVYAVHENRKGRLIAIITGQIAKSGLVRFSNDYQFDDFRNDLAEHGAIIVVKATTFCCSENPSTRGHPAGVEPGDWYSRQPVGIEDIQRIMVGQEMLDWLNPHEMDFACRFREVLRVG